MVDSNGLGSHRDLTLSSDKRKRMQKKLDTLIRYDEDWQCCGMRISDKGEYVSYSQVKKILEKL